MNTFILKNIMILFLIITPIYSEDVILCKWSGLDTPFGSTRVYLEETLNDHGGLSTLAATIGSYAYQGNGDIIVTSKKEIVFWNLKIHQVRKLLLTDGKFYEILLGYNVETDIRKKFDSKLECKKK